MNPSGDALPRVVADIPVDAVIEQLLAGQVELLPWSGLGADVDPSIDAIYTFGHPKLDGQMMDRAPNAKLISNYGVGVDHIQLADAAARGIPVGNTPGVLDGATADMAFCLLMAAARRVAEGDRYARGPNFTRYDPSFMLGREIHGATLGILGLGRIGAQVARRARGFDMRVLYHNRRRRDAVERELSARYAPFAEVMSSADYVVICVPLTEETRNLIGAAELALIKPTATLINIARGAVVDTDALTKVLQERRIHAAGLDVTEPEPLPREHPLLALGNVVITPHLGSATVQTRQKMAEVSVANLLAGLAGRPLLHQVG